MKSNTGVCLLVGILLGLATCSSGHGQERAQVRIPAAGPNAKAVVSFNHLPLGFEENEGQVNQRVRYLARGQGFRVFLTQDDAVLQLLKSGRAGQPVGTSSSNLNGFPISGPSAATADVVRLKLLGASHHSRISASDPLPGYTSYFLGNSPRHWHTKIPNYARLRYHEIYPDIDLAYYGQQGQLENDFMLAPGADPKLIRLGLQGAKNMHLNASGDLALTVNGGTVYLRRPRAYQGKGANRSEIPVRYVLRAGNEVGFSLGSYNHREELVIDPVLTYSTYLGGSGGDVGYGIAVDSAGNTYVTGTTSSINFPTTTGNQATLGGGGDVFVAKLNPGGTALLYSVFIGGGNLDRATGIALDSSGNAYVTGYTDSTDFPTTSGAEQLSNNGNTDAFLAKLDATGSSLVYATYLGGSGIDYGRGVAVDASGDAFITGSTQSTDFPTMNPLQVGLDGGSDAFLAEFDPTGANLLYSTYLGGSGSDEALAIALDSSGNPYIAGYTFSSNFPTQNPLQSTLSGSSDAFVTEIDPGTSSLVFSTYLGGSGDESAQSIAIDSVGSIYITGKTTSSGYPLTSGPFQSNYAGQGDAFVTKLAPGGTQMVYSTYLGGSGLDQGNSIAIDSSGEAFITGFTQSGDFPLADALQRVLGISGAGSCGATPCADAFITKLGPSGNVVYSTYLGGSATELGQAIASDASGAAYLTGSTNSTNFPVIAGAPQSSYAGTNSSTNVFIAKVSPQDASAVALSPQSLNFGNQALNNTSDSKSVTLVNAGSAPLNISSIAVSGQFSQTNNCGSVVPAGGGTCTINVTFTPTQTGSVTDQVTISDDAAGSPQSITVTGSGVTSAGTLSVTPTSLTFAALTVGQTSPAQTVQLSNTGNTAINISSITASGDFAETNTCGTLPAVLNVGATCSISVTFTPTATGTLSGGISIQDDAANSPQAVSLSGIGSAVFSLSASSRSSVILIGTKSTTFTVTASAPSTFTDSITLSCTTGTCTFSPTSITPGQSSTVTVSGLSATTANPYDFAVKGTSGGQDTTVSLTIFFADFSLSKTAPTPALRTVAAGGSTTYTVTVTPLNGFNQVVLLGCSNLPQLTTCSYSPPGITMDGTNPVTSTLTVTTTASTSSQLPPAPPGGSAPWGHWHLVWWAYLLAFFLIIGASFAVRGRRVFGMGPLKLRASFVILLLAASLSAAAVACNNTYYGPTTTPVSTGTPPNTYTITLVGKLGSDNSITRTTTVNLAVSP